MSMKGKLLEFPVTAEIPIYEGGPILPYADAAAVRADLDLLSDTELEAIYAATDGARTFNALVKYDALGNLVDSGATDNGSTFTLSLPLGLGAASPARRLEVRDATAPQQRWSYSDTVFGERQVDANGVVTETNTSNGRRWEWAGKLYSAFLDFGTNGTGYVRFGSPAGGNPVFIASGAYFLRISSSSTGTSLQSNANDPLHLQAGASTKFSVSTVGVSFFGATPVAQCAAISDPTDATTTQAALISLLTYLRSRGDIAT